MFKMTNSTNMEKELFSKTDPTRFQKEGEIELKTIIFYLLSSWKIQRRERSTW
jgi:hypothetical protein